MNGYIAGIIAMNAVAVYRVIKAVRCDTGEVIWTGDAE